VYYAYGMTKQHKHKRRIISLILGVLLFLGVAGGYYYWQSTKQTSAPVVDSAIRDEVKKLNLAGDQTLAAQYASALKSGDASGAQKVFDAAVDERSTKREKAALLSQNVSLALAYKQNDAALQAALEAVKVQPVFTTYNDASRVYAVIGDYWKQQEMLQKAIDSLSTSDVANKEQVLTALNRQMDEVKEQLARESNPS
jgi:flagellar basal body-associated protein FliL